MRQNLVSTILVLMLATVPYSPVRAQVDCSFKLGFAMLRDLISATESDLVGVCLEDERFEPETGNVLQRTKGGLMVWRKADNWTAFTNGHTTWINGPDGLASRPNAGPLFPWEAAETAQLPALPEGGRTTGEPPRVFPSPAPTAQDVDPVEVWKYYRRMTALLDDAPEGLKTLDNQINRAQGSIDLLKDPAWRLITQHATDGLRAAAIEMETYAAVPATAARAAALLSSIANDFHYIADEVEAALERSQLARMNNAHSRLPGLDQKIRQAEEDLRALIQASMPAPELGALIVEDPLTRPGALKAFGCPNNAQARQFVSEGYLMSVTGSCTSAPNNTNVTNTFLGLTVPDGDVQVEIKPVAGVHRLRFVLGIRMQPSREGYVTILNPAAGSAVLRKTGPGLDSREARRFLAGALGLNVWTKIAMRADGSRVWLLVNEEPILWLVDSTFSNGNPRGDVLIQLVRVGSDDDKEESAAIVRNLRVSALAAGDASRTPVYKPSVGSQSATAGRSRPCTCRLGVDRALL